MQGHEQTSVWRTGPSGLMAALLVAIFGGLLVGLSGCGEQAVTQRTSGPGEPLPDDARVVVSIPPLAGLVQPLLPEGVEIITLLEAGQSAHGWEPTPGAVASIKRADVVVLVGMGLEPRIEQILDGDLPNDPMILRMSDMLGLGEGHLHVHKDGDAHAHTCSTCGTGGDPHLWLDPVLAARFVRSAGPILSTPDRQSAWVARIEALEQELAQTLAPVRGKAIVSHHAAFGRLADHYGLVVAEVLQPIESAEPTPGELASAIQTVNDGGIGVIFIEPQFSPAAAEFVASATGVRLARLDPLGSGDWIETVRAIGETIARELAAEPVQPEPVQSEPVQSEPAQPEPAQTGQAAARG